MNASYRWLRALAPTLTDTARQAADRLTQVAVPVDEVVPLAEGLADIVIARVDRIQPHPNADRLVVCQVDAGGGGSAQVVTGAPNVVEGAFYPFVGAGKSLPGGRTIREVKLRGEASQGMLCSERELGLGRDQAGIMRLWGEFVPGQALIEALELDDYRLVLDVTPNRPDLLGHRGVARELAPGGDADLVLPSFPGSSRIGYGVEEDRHEAAAGGVTVRIEDPEGCPRYMGLVIRGVEIAPSPEWLAGRLRAIGLQPINNVVDATNYVLYELNQPLHAFDISKLGGAAVVIRRARTGESLRTLDGRDRQLDPEILVIADAEDPCALAGVMGGQESEVDESTTDILLECAYFDPMRVRRARRRFLLDTDAAYRFERGIDRDGQPEALWRVAELIVTVAGGEAAESAVDVQPRPADRQAVTLRPTRVAQVLGKALDKETIRDCLEPLGFQTENSEGGLQVKVPTWRPDVEREVDLIEEVARRHGYGEFPETFRPYRATRVPDDMYFVALDRVREAFVQLGFLEARTSPLVPQSEGDVAILNRLSERESHLRRDLLTGLAHEVERNFTRGQRDVRLFQIGTVFLSLDGTVPEERVRLAATWTGRRQPAHWATSEEDWDVWDLRWIFGRAAETAYPDAEVRPADIAAGDGRPRLELPFAAASTEGQAIGWAGRLAEGVVDAPPWAGAVWGLEIEVAPAPPRLPQYQPLPVYPAVERDLAIVVPRDRLAAEVEGIVRSAGPPSLESLAVFDVYEGPNIPKGTRSVAWRLRFRAADRTLTDREVDEGMRSIVMALEEKLDVKVRGA